MPNYFVNNVLTTFTYSNNITIKWFDYYLYLEEKQIK